MLQARPSFLLFARVFVLPALPSSEAIMATRGANSSRSAAMLDRRRLLQLLAAAGVSVPAAIDLLAQARKPISADILRSASSVIGEDFSDERLEVIETALQRNLDQFQIVRDLEVGDLVEPAPVFNPRRLARFGARAPQKRR